MCFICQTCSAVRGWNQDTGTVCGPKLEALTERAESAVAGCRPGWLSQEHGVETPLPHDTLCQACAPRHGVSPSGILLRTEKEEVRTNGQLGCTVPKRVHHSQASFGKATTGGDSRRHRTVPTMPFPTGGPCLGLARVELPGSAGMGRSL